MAQKFLHSMAETAERRGYHVLTFPRSGVEPDDEVAVYHEMIESGRVDGFVLSETNLNDARIRYLMDVGFPEPAQLLVKPQLIVRDSTALSAEN